MRQLETSWDLLEAACAGAERAQAALVERYGPALQAYFRGRGVDAHQAEDLTQAALLRLFSGVLARADPRQGSFRSLLGTIAYRVWASHLREASARKRGGPQAPPLDVDEHEVPAREAEQSFDREWFARLLELALTRLAHEHPSYFAVIDACLVQGRAQEEVATQRGCALQDVRNHLLRGRRKLHDYVSELIAGYAPEPDLHATELRFLGALGLADA